MIKKLFWFGIAGGTGFVVDAAVLYLLITLTPTGAFVARIISILVAMLSTWIINRYLTFGRSERRLAEEGARYLLVGALGACVNYAIYALCLLLIPGIWPVLATAISSVGAMVLSYLGYSRFVFGR